MAVPTEDYGLRSLRVSGDADEGCPFYAVDRPSALCEALGRAAREQFAKLPLRGRLHGNQAGK